MNTKITSFPVGKSQNLTICSGSIPTNLTIGDSVQGPETCLSLQTATQTVSHVQPKPRGVLWRVKELIRKFALRLLLSSQ